MKRRLVPIAVGVTVAALLALGGTALGRGQASQAAGKPVPLDAATSRSTPAFEEVVEVQFQ